jgi:cation diffusion facilitator family transporter
MFVSLFNYFAIYSSEKKADSTFNYGRWKIEALASFFEWLIITGSWLYILYESIMKIINQEEISYLWVSVLIMIISIILTWGLVYFLTYVSKKTNNLVIKSDAIHYKTDLYSNIWIIIWLVIIYFTNLYIIDAIIWIIIAIYIIYSAWELVHKWYLLLLDVALEYEEVEKIKDIIKSKNLVTNFHELKTRQIWNLKHIEVNLVFNPEILLVDAHRVANHVETNIKKIDDKCERRVMIHLDPYDDPVF